MAPRTRLVPSMATVVPSYFRVTITPKIIRVTTPPT